LARRSITVRYDQRFRKYAATLLDEITRKDNRCHHLRVIVEERDGEYLARLTCDQGSGILLSMMRAQGLAIILEDMDHLPAGVQVRVLMLDWPERG